ncbi:MAG: hypothetical protein ACK4ND_18985, partial [Cytophagaceae bacterium]
MKFLQASFLSGLSVAVRSVGMFIINKLVAVFYGPDGITLLAHFQNFLSILLTTSTDGINRGLIKYLSDRFTGTTRYRDVFWTSLILNLAVFVLVAGGVLIYRDYFIDMFALGIGGWYWFFAILFALLFHLLNYFFLSVLLSVQKIKIYVGLNIGATVLSVLMVTLGVYLGHIGWVLLLYGFGSASLFWLAAIIVVRLKPQVRSLKEYTFTWHNFRQIFGFIAMALSVVFFGKIVDFLVRDY